MPARFIRAKIVLAATAFCSGLALHPSAALASEESTAAHRPNVATELVVRSLSMLGVNYKFGGNSPDSGLDCSGLVRLVYAETIGRVLPRRSVEMSREGEAVSRDELKPGDLVFFNTLRRAFSHVGIYIGDNQFVHAPSRGKSVRVESMDSSYWAKRFNGARRMLAADAHANPSSAAIARAQAFDSRGAAASVAESRLPAQPAGALSGAALLGIGALSPDQSGPDRQRPTDVESLSHSAYLN